MNIKCLNCGKDVFSVTKRRRFCSQKCADSYRYKVKDEKGIWTNCAYCGKEIYTRPWQMKFKNRFCNKEHHLLFQKETAFSKKCVICGQIFKCQPCQIEYRHRKTCSIACRAILQTLEAKKNRKKNGFTQGQINRCIRNSKEAIDWRKEVFARDDYTCQVCGKRGTHLEAHHLKSFAEFPKLRFELSNGQTLSRECHDKTKKGGLRKKSYRI